MIGAIGGRRRSGGAVGIVQGPVSTSATNTVTFAATPADGNLIVLLAYVTDSSGATIATPSGFTAGPSGGQGGSRPIAMFWRVASSEASATYTVTTDSGAMRVAGYVLSGFNATPVGNSDNNSVPGAATSIACATTAFNVSEGSLVLAFRGSNSGTSSPAFDNSFTGTLLGVFTGISMAHRSYAGAATAQNTTASWTTSRSNNRSLLIEILKA